MNPTFKVSVGEAHFEIKQSAALAIDAIENEPDHFHILYREQSYQAIILELNPFQKTVVVLVNGNKYAIQIADEYDQLVEKMGLSKDTAQQIKDIKAPMPGLILSTKVKVGQTVVKGDALLILEAMKMENVLKATGDGIIKSILTQKGDAVDKGQVLIELE